MKKWMKPLDFTWDEAGRNPINSITNVKLLRWVDEYFSPDEWIIHLTGGEPALYKELAELLIELGNRGFKVIISTNGILPIPKHDHVRRVAAWHEIMKEPPEYFDSIIILEPNPNDDTEAKKKYCDDNNIPYKTKRWKPFGDRQIEKVEGPVDNKITHMVRLLSQGQITCCYSTGPVKNNYNIYHMSKPVLRDLVSICPRCEDVYDVEIHIPKEWLV